MSSDNYAQNFSKLQKVHVLRKTHFRIVYTFFFSHFNNQKVKCIKRENFFFFNKTKENKRVVIVKPHLLKFVTWHPMLSPHHNSHPKHKDKNNNKVNKNLIKV